MKKALKDKWVKALRSGNYKQGQGSLCQIQASEAAYCCLGVLVEETEGEDVWASGRASFALYDGYAGMPPLAFMDKVGLPLGMADKLADMNDGWATFEDIAAFIELQKL